MGRNEGDTFTEKKKGLTTNRRKSFDIIVPEVGLEPTRGLPSLDFESSASAIPPLRLERVKLTYLATFRKIAD